MTAAKELAASVQNEHVIYHVELIIVVVYGLHRTCTVSHYAVYGVEFPRFDKHGNSHYDGG